MKRKPGPNLPVPNATSHVAGSLCASGVVCAVLMPHAPILVPEVGGERGGAAAAVASRRAMRRAADCILSHCPEKLVLISPHSPRQPQAFGLWVDDPLEGTFAQFNAPHVSVSLPLARMLAKSITAEAEIRNLEMWKIQGRALDHGALVPLWFLAEAGWTGPTVILSLRDSEVCGAAILGEVISAAAGALSARIAIVASGDMSHRLTPGAPCGFHPQAHEFDEEFIRLVRSGDYRKIACISPDLREVAAEDAVDTTLIAASAAKWKTAGHQVINYEGPFGVGYGVAILFSEKSPSSEEMASPPAVKTDGATLAGLARHSVETALQKSSDMPPEPAGQYLGAKGGVFVTIRRKDGALRGCVGTIDAVCENIVDETWRNARLAAFHDRRFAPVTSKELFGLRFEVSVLHAPEEVCSEADLDPLRYGVIASTSDGRVGLLLPGIKEITTTEEQLSIVRQKGQISPDEPIRLKRFQVDHFEETA